MKKKFFSITNGIEKLENTLKYEYGINNKISRIYSINANGTFITDYLYNEVNTGNYTTIDDQCNQIEYQVTHAVGKDPNYLLGINPIYIANGISLNVVEQYDITITQNGDIVEYIDSYEYTYNEQNYPLSQLYYSNGILLGRNEYTYEY